MALSRSQFLAMLKRLEKPVQDAFVIAANKAKTRAQINALVKAIETGNIDAIVAAAGVRESMWSGLSESIRNAYAQNGSFVIATDLPKRFATEFDIINPRAESWLRINSSQLITGRLVPDQRAAIQVMLQDGMVKGKNPRSVALDIVGRMGSGGRRTGGVIGLNEQQAQFVINMSDDLAILNNQSEWHETKYFNRKLRDRRYDKMVKASFDRGVPLPKKTRDKIVNRYEDRMLKHRGDTIGRTETLRAVNEASDEALRQVVDEGLAPRNSVIRIWRHSFGPNEREGHIMMNGQERGIDEFFMNPITGVPLQYPGAGPPGETVNCRCYVEHKIDFVAVELAA